MISWAGTGALEQGESWRRRQQLAQDNCSRHTNTLGFEVELRDAVLTKRDKRDATEFNHGSVVEFLGDGVDDGSLGHERAGAAA